MKKNGEISEAVNDQRIKNIFQSSSYKLVEETIRTGKGDILKSLNFIFDLESKQLQESTKNLEQFYTTDFKNETSDDIIRFIKTLIFTESILKEKLEILEEITQKEILEKRDYLIQELKVYHTVLREVLNHLLEYHLPSKL